jgi:ABC-type multidrug transport system ATPase subunit
MHAQQAMIEFSNAGKKYGSRRGVDALKDISLVIPAGGVCAVVGPNGAGKSTLLGLLLGFLRPTSGSVSIDGDAPRDYLHAHGIGYLPDRFSLPAGWPVGRAVHALLGLHGVAADDVEAAIDRYELRPHASKKIGDLSRGLLQRVGLAQAFTPGRPLIVLDEPAEGLDPIWRIRLRDMIAAQRDHGHTVVLASHDLAEVERIADMVVILDRGSIREVISVRSSEAMVYRVNLEQPVAAIDAIFPDAVAVEGGGYLIRVHDLNDLNRRVAALIEVGGRVTSLRPGGELLEERMRRTADS